WPRGPARAYPDVVLVVVALPLQAAPPAPAPPALSGPAPAVLSVRAGPAVPAGPALVPAVLAGPALVPAASGRAPPLPPSASSAAHSAGNSGIVLAVHAISESAMPGTARPMTAPAWAMRWSA